MKNVRAYIIAAVVSIIAGSAAAGVSSIGSTAAYLSDDESKTNIVSIGEQKIRITEEFDPPETPEVGVNTYKKDVKVTNTGDVPCYARVFIEFSDNDVRGVSSFSADGTTYYPLSEFKNHLPEGWVYIEDAADALSPYYYYTLPIEKNASTPSLIKSVKTTFATAEDIEAFDILVYAESVQTLDKNGVAFTGSSAWRSAWAEYLAN